MSTILVLDDRSANRDLLAVVLGYRGHEVLQAADGIEGLNLLRARRADLVIADVLMPAMDGFEFVRRLRREPAAAGTPVIFYTANYLEHEARAIAGSCGVTEILIKPAEPDAVLAAVDRALNRVGPPVTSPEDDDFRREHTRLLTNKVAGAVMRLEVASERLAALVHLGQQLAAETDIHRLVDSFAREARDIMGARVAGIGILGEPGRGLRQFVVVGGAEAESFLVVDGTAGLFGAILARGTVRVDGELDGGQASVLPAPHRAARSLVGAAVRTAAAAYGWVYFLDKGAGVPFSAEDEQLAGLLAAQLAVAYESARRLERIEQHAATLERRVDERTEALKRSNADLQQFAYVASHDLQEPLRMVSSYPDLLARRYKGRLDADADEFIEFARDGAVRMQALIRDLLAYSRLDRRNDDVTPMPLDDALDGALANLEPALRETGASIARAPLPIVAVAKGQFVQLFQNLIGNAIKFRGERPPDIRITVDRDDNDWVFTVRDSGIGIAPEFHDRIFVIFQRLHSRADYPGTGIGLAICKRVVERHGGRMWVVSQPGLGSAFHFTVPVSHPASVPVRCA